MKKLFFVILATLTGAIAVNAQSLPVHPRVEVGGNFANIITKYDGKDHTADIKPGVWAGVAVEIPIGTSGMFVAPGLTYKMQGTKETDSKSVVPGTIIDSELSSTLHYLSVPVDLGIRVDLAPVAISVEFGPYFAYALKGTTTESISYNGSYDKLPAEVKDMLERAKQDTPADIFEKDKEGNVSTKRFDVGVGASAAVEFKRFYLRIGSELGLMNIAGKSLENEGVSSKNANFYVSVGFRL